MGYGVAVFVIAGILFLFGASAAHAVYYIPPGGSPGGICDPPFSYTPISDFCWNSQAVGVTSCGAACDGGLAWEKYHYIRFRLNLLFVCDATW